MEKASKAIRRSGVRLKSLSGGHGDLQMIISQLGEVRTCFKAFAVAQSQASEDIMKWASCHENRAIGETFSHLAELSLLWAEVQREFSEQLKEYRSLYELILEGEKHVTQARETLVAREQREAKLRKEYKKASKKAPVEEVRILKERLNQAERSRDLAHLELVERVGENEAVKMIRIKEGLLKFGAAYQELAQKCLIVYTAHQSVTSELPEVHNKDLHDVKYTGSEAARKYVCEAREKVRAYYNNGTPSKPPVPDDPPPPYTPSLEHLNDLSNSRQNGFNGNSHIPSNINNSAIDHPSAPRASVPSVNIHHPYANGISPGVSPHPRSGLDNRPTAPSISSSTINSPLPNSPPSHIYPELPKAQGDVPIPPPPKSGPECPSDQHAGTHFQSVPNLGDGSSLDHGLRYPPFNTSDRSSFNDSSFHPDSSSSSPSLLATHLPKTSTPADSPPYNPYYDWLPSHIADKFTNTGGRNDSPPESETNEESVTNKQLISSKKSVRPKNLNPFLEVSDDDDNSNSQGHPVENSASGAVKKASVR